MNQTISKKAIKAGFFVTFGFGASQGLRLAGNIVLTRLLVPEFFGIMALCNVFLQGLHLFSDIGLEPGVIRSPRANDPVFLNTVWTIQALRGFLVFVISLVIAYPVSLFYEEPKLAVLVPVLCIVSIISGFNSTSLISLGKELKQGILVTIELAEQLISIVFMIIVAYYYRSIWSLVCGALVAAGVKLVASHLITQTHKTRFAWDKTAIVEIFTFGKWIFVSTAMFFLATQSDRLLLGKLLPLAFFGVYNLAVMFSELPKQVISTISIKVLYPFLSKYSHLERHELREAIRRQRRVLVYPLAVLVAIFSCFGDFLIILLYDDRYIQASWILPLLAIGIWPMILHMTNRVLFVIGEPKYSAFGNTLKFVYMVVCIPLFFRIAGILGAVLVVVMNDIPVYGAINYGLIREKLSLLKQDALATIFLFLIVVLFLIVRNVSGLGLPGMEAYLTLNY